MLAGCVGPRQPQAPTQDVAAIFTLAHETFAAERTATAVHVATARSATPFPTSTATAGAGRPAVPQSTCDNATYLADVTIPDGTLVAAGSSFVKTWTLQNSGTCAWTTAYRLSPVGGDSLQGTDTVLAAAVPSGARTDVSVTLTAPTTAGTYNGQWQMRNAQQRPFGNVITVVITVGAAAECKRSSKTTVTIMGHGGPENTTIDYGVGTTVTDQHGDYAFQVPEGWSGTVTPSKAKVNPWSFTPPFRTYSNVRCDLRNENYKATAPPGV